jgi:glycosyltransferase involved in cell wall biosynthesis
VFHGNLGYYQDLELIKKVGQRLLQKKMEVKILIAGKGSEDYRLNPNNIPENIEYIGSQPYERIPEIIKKAHIGLSFRKPGKISEDSFPVRTYEYIGVGLPIVITPISEAGNFVSSNGIGFQFESDNIEGILAIIEQLYCNNSLYNDIVDRIKLNRHEFSRERMSSEFAKLIIDRTAEFENR